MSEKVRERLPDEECVCGCDHEFGDLVLNVGRLHFAICKRHGCYWCAGDNLLSGWREETEEQWEKNAAKLSRLRKRTDEMTTITPQELTDVLGLSAMVCSWDMEAFAKQLYELPAADHLAPDFDSLLIERERIFGKDEEVRTKVQRLKDQTVELLTLAKSVAMETGALLGMDFVGDHQRERAALDEIPR